LHDYEIVAVLRPDLEEDAIEAALGRIHQRIVEHGGSIKTTDRWGKRRLSYAIQKYRDGYYILSVFSLDAKQVGRLRQTLGLQENLLRFVVADHHPAPARPAPAGTAQPSAGQTTAPAGAPATPPAQGAPGAPAATPAPPAMSPAGGGTPSQTGGEGGDV
jgi:small subunit ribosomal protein S6